MPEVSPVPLKDVTAQGVEHALLEFDRLGRETFLRQYRFGPARGYFLIRGEHRYDSKAVVGVAHAYDRPDLGPLRPQDFSGGDATVARHLESLGFDVERPPRNPRWTEEELVLALDLYLRSGKLEDTDQAVAELSRVLRSLEIHPKDRRAESFRNASGVATKLANFAEINPNDKGLPHYGKLDKVVWKRYASDEDALAAAASAIRQGLGLPAELPDEPGQVQVIEVSVEAQHVERFHVSIPNKDVEATRSEQSLVLAFKQHLESQGHRVTRHEYPLGGPARSLYCDLVDETEHVLYEAKGDVLRTSVRMAIGQLLDYRRFEESPPRLAVLLPRQPVRDVIDLIRSVPASVVWRTENGFEGA